MVRIASLVVALLALCTPAAAPSALDSEAALERSILAEVNAVRSAAGLGPLRTSAPLAHAAGRHSRAMARHGFFAHASPEGTVFWRRIARSYEADGYATWRVGENLLWSSSRLDGRAAVRMWLASPPHRRVLLGAHWREVGISAMRAQAAPGLFGGRDVTIVTADFGVRG